MNIMRNLSSAPKPVEKPEPIDNTELVKEFRAEGGHILHVHSYRNNDGHRALTVAFIPRSGRIEVATSVTHRNDTFTKKIGTKAAIEHFRAGRTIDVPLLKQGKGPTRQLWEMFNRAVWH
jgi:hypothetical protein